MSGPPGKPFALPVALLLALPAGCVSPDSAGPQTQARGPVMVRVPVVEQVPGAAPQPAGGRGPAMVQVPVVQPLPRGAPGVPQGAVVEQVPGQSGSGGYVAAVVSSALMPGTTEGSEWDVARRAQYGVAAGAMAGVVANWRSLSGSDGFGFGDYAAFLLRYPGFPDEARLRASAEKALVSGRSGAVDSGQIVAFFDRFAPLSNVARGQYALALAAVGRRDAADVARSAWRGGSLNDADEAAIRARWGAGFSVADGDARLDALLWDGNVAQALRAIAGASSGARDIGMARIALAQGRDPEAPAVVQAAPVGAGSATGDFGRGGGYAPPPQDDAGAGANAGQARAPVMLPGAPPVAVVVGAPVPPPVGALADPGYVHDRARFLLRHGRAAEAASLLVNRPVLSRPPLDVRRWVALELAVAHEATPDASIRIAESADGFAPGTDVSQLPFAVRDEYTSLMWLGGTQALWWRGDGVRAAALFRRYAAAARTPQTRAKGLYWAGRAMAKNGDGAGASGAARADWQAAAAWPDQFYGMLALEALGMGLPSLADPAHGAVSRAQRAAFDAAPLTQAVIEVARDGDWPTTVRFFRTIADAGRSESDFVLLADLARRLGRRDLGVIAGSAAETAGYSGFRDVAFPVIPTPMGSDWIAVHAVARQESQFAQNAVSSAGARGLMQLMPGTAAEQARKLGVGYSYAGLVSDPALNIAVGNAYFTHLLGVYGGSWPLAAAAYNAGPGNVARWLREVGDPRGGSIDWVDWIERIPLSETRGYVAHIVENAVVYEARNPAHGHAGGRGVVGYYLRGR